MSKPISYPASHSVIHPVSRLKTLYEQGASLDLGLLPSIYSDDVVFKDPLHQLRGLEALRNYMEAVYNNVQECRFEYLDQIQQESCGYIKWNMHFRHRKLGSDLITVRGMSQFQFDQKITYHEDVYDVGAMVYEHIPLLGGIVRVLKKRMIKAALR